MPETIIGLLRAKGRHANAKRVERPWRRDVLRAPADLFVERGLAEHIRSDNGQRASAFRQGYVRLE
jgi:hypothetical protein